MSPSLPHHQAPIILFDGVCHLCAGAVKFILRHDVKGRYFFAPLQSPLGQQLLKQHQLDASNLDTFVLIEEGQAYTRSTAALRIARHLTWPWKAAYPARWIPQRLRDPIYHFVAKHRYQCFGKSDSCLMPDPTWKHRFL